MRRLQDSAVFLGAFLSGFVALAVLLGPLITPHNYYEQDLSNALQPPFWYPKGNLSHPLGTDYLGRDLLSRVLTGGRISLAVGLSSVVVSGLVGMLLGVLAAHYGGWVDALIMRLVDVQLSLPPLFVAIAVMAVIGQSLLNLILVLAGVSWVRYARVARGAALALRQREFVDAARALGAPDRRVVLTHIVPNILSPVMVVATVNVSAMILAEASLSFLGLGVDPLIPSWGGMLSTARSVYHVAWWNVVFPGLAIVVTVTGINLLGEGLKKGRTART